MVQWGKSFAYVSVFIFLYFVLYDYYNDHVSYIACKTD